MSVQGGSNHNYISNAELLIWMAEKTGSLNEQMAEAMDVTKQRADIAKRLSDIKTDLNGIDKDGGKGCRATDEMRALLEQYKDHPDAQELAETLQPIIDRLDQARAAWVKEHPVDGQAPGTPINLRHGGNPYPVGHLVDYLPAGPDAYMMLSPKAAEVADWQSKIQAQIDKFGAEDHIALIQIQDLSSRSNQAMQLASNLIASNNEAAKAAIGNIRG